MHYLIYLNSFLYLRGFRIFCIFFLTLVSAAHESGAAQTHQLQLAVLMELNSCLRGKETVWKERILHRGMRGKLHWGDY